MSKTIRMTTAQALVKFLDNQYVSVDGVETKFVEGIFTIFGHGIAVGLGEALDSDPVSLRCFREEMSRGCAIRPLPFQNRITGRKSFRVPHPWDRVRPIW